MDGTVRLMRTARFWSYEAPDPKVDAYKIEKNIKYLKMLLFGAIPARASSLDSNRMMVLMFCVNSLAMMDSLSSLTEDEKTRIKEWIYSRQTLEGGFDGGADIYNTARYGQLALTYSALIALMTLGDDLSRIDREKFATWIKSLQLPDGSFQAVSLGSESDSRFVYSAVASCFLLKDWSGVNRQSAVEFILSCWNESDGGFGLRPHQESHGGATYTCLASLKLLNALDRLTKAQVQAIVMFCVMKQDTGQGGFSGRCNKDCDTCYAYWVGASLLILERNELIHKANLTRYLDTTEHPLVGGFGKTSSDMSDPYHTHFGVCARTFTQANPESIMVPSLGLIRSAFDAYSLKL